MSGWGEAWVRYGKKTGDRRNWRWGWNVTRETEEAYRWD